MTQRKLTEFEKVQIAAERKAENSRKFASAEIIVIVEDYTDKQGSPRVIVRERKQ